MWLMQLQLDTGEFINVLSTKAEEYMSGKVCFLTLQESIPLEMSELLLTNALGIRYSILQSQKIPPTILAMARSRQLKMEQILPFPIIVHKMVFYYSSAVNQKSCRTLL